MKQDSVIHENQLSLKLMDSSTKGQYICQLCTKSGSESHVIGIYCDDNRIYDCVAGNVCFSFNNGKY